MVSLLTRKVRLPIPSLAMINQSRQFGSSFENQKLWDIFRFPWVPHPYDAPEIPGASSDEEEEDGSEGAAKGKKGKKGKKAKAGGENAEGKAGDVAASEAFGSTGRSSIPSWLHDEQVVDKGTAAVPGAKLDFNGKQMRTDPHDAPDHFKHFLKAQQEWFPYETYHKIAMLYGVCCFFHAVCYYCIITAMSELRGFWIAWAIPGVFMTAQYWLIQLDIFQAKGQQFLKGFEIFGQIAPYFASAACAMEFRFQYSKAQVALAWAFAMMSLGSHLLFACRFFDLMTPDTLPKEMEEEDGKSWWPKNWPVPLAFTNTLFQLTPPKKLKKGQHDLLHEALTLETETLVVEGKAAKVRRRKAKESPGKKRTKRGTPQNPQVLLQHVDVLQDKLANVYPEVAGKDQSYLTNLQTHWHKAKKEAEALGRRRNDGDSSGSGSEGSSDGFTEYTNMKQKGDGYMTHDQYLMKLAEVGDNLNWIEGELEDMAKKYEVSAAEDGEGGINGQSIESDSPTTGWNDTPYWIMRAAVATHIFIWLFIMVCTGIEIVLGPVSLFAPPGEPPWIRNIKMRPYQSDRSYLHLSSDPLPEWYRLFVAATIPEGSVGDVHHGGVSGGEGHGGGGHGGGGGGHGGGQHRRLHDAGGSKALSHLYSSLPALDWLAEKYLKDDEMAGWQAPAEAPAAITGMPTTMEDEDLAARKTTSVPTSGFMTPSLQSLPIEWPPLFEPRHLACQARSSGAAIAALTPRGFGALVHISNRSETLEGHTSGTLATEKFSFSGISALSPLVGLSWGSTGLHLMTRAGQLLQCPGHVPIDGAWACHTDEAPPVPISRGAALRAGAVKVHAATGRTIALLFEDMPQTVVLYKEDIGTRAWQPAGELHLPPGSRHASLSFSNDALMMVLEDGAVHSRPLQEGAVPSLLPAPASSVTAREWHSACTTSAGEGGIIRLALRQVAPHAAAAWQPELVASSRIGKHSPLVEV